MMDEFSFVCCVIPCRLFTGFRRKSPLSRLYVQIHPEHLTYEEAQSIANCTKGYDRRAKLSYHFVL